MDYGKVDAALACALSEAAPGEPAHLRVSLRTQGPPSPKEQDELKNLGVQGLAPGRSVFSGSFSPGDLAELSQKPYVRLISLAQPMRPLI